MAPTAADAAPSIEEVLQSIGNYGSVRVARADTIAALKEYAEVFIDFFLHEQLTLPVPAFHKRIWRLMTTVSIPYAAFAVPRNHAKTTLAKLAAVWYWLYTDFRFIVYVSNTATVAAQAVVDIIEYLKSPNFANLFGPPIFSKELTGDGEFHFTITTAAGKQKRCIIKARGANQQVRGLNIDNQRPELAIVDDLEDRDNTESPQLQKKLITWFYGTFFKALDKRRHKIIYIGNMVGAECLLNKLCTSARWHSMRLGAILSDGSSLWPEMWTVEQLIEDYQEYVRLGLASLWYAEMMNLITMGANSIIQMDEILYLDQCESEYQRAGFITIDPATGQGGDKTAIVVHVLRGQNSYDVIPQVVDFRWGQIDELQTVLQAIELAYEWGISVIGVEAVAYQHALLVLFQLVLAQRGITGFDIIPLMPGKRSKLTRIRSWTALLKEKAYALMIGDTAITQQLLQFDTTKENNEDDLIDACAQGPMLMAEHSALILSKQLHMIIDSTPLRQEALC